MFTNGCFDILHIGHTRLLRAAKSFGDVLILGLNTDASIRRIKGAGRPVVAEHDRAEILACLEFVDYVVFFDEDDPRQIISVLRPDVHVKGGDYKPESLPETEIVTSYGGRVETVSLTPGRSTSHLIDRVRGEG